MMDTRIACPHCGKRLRSAGPVTLGDRFRCSGCNTSFNLEEQHVVTGQLIRPATAVSNSAPRRSDTMPHVALPTWTDAPAPPSAPPQLGSPAVPPPLPQRSPAAMPGGTRAALLIAAACAALVIITGSIVLALSNRNGEKKDGTPSADARKKQPERGDSPRDKPEPKPAPKQEPKAEPKDEPKPEPAREPSRPGGRPEFPLRPDEPGERHDPPRGEPEPRQVAMNTLPAEVQEKVNKAIDRGVAYLKRQQPASGTWGVNFAHGVGMAALPGLTLLECGVPAKDPAVQKAAAFVRQHAPRETQTYDISLAILFLDRLGEPRDRRLIQSLALRLMAGQMPSGGWTYTCPVSFTPQEEYLLFTALQQTRPKKPSELFERDKGDSAMESFVTRVQEHDRMMTTGRLGGDPAVTSSGGLRDGFGRLVNAPVGTKNPSAPGAAVMALEELAPRKLNLDQLPNKLRNLPLLRPVPDSKDLPQRDITDNSNTQFAILGIWAAQRHHVPMERTLALLVKRFRKSQNGDGSWGYHYSTSGAHGTPAMICSGLLGLAVGHGLIGGKEQKKDSDPAIEKGFDALAHHVGGPALGKRVPKDGRAARRPITSPGLNLYFLWSVERVGVLYGVPGIGDRDWYAWGVELLLPAQGADGHWLGGGYPGSTAITDSCFALLFLKRANLTHDLSTRLQFLIRVGDGQK